MALPKIPINMKTLAKAGQVFEGQSSDDTVVEVLVDTSASGSLVSLSRSVLEVRPGTLELTISGFNAEMPALNKEASLIIVIAGTSAFLKRIMEIALWSEHKCVVLTQDAPGLVATVPAEDALDIAETIIEVDCDKPKEVLEQDFARWCIAHLPDLRLSFGAAFPYMRELIARDLTRQTAFENAAIAAVFFLPGADLPILTLNQAKLLYQIAVLNEVPLSRERLVDLAAVIISAFGLRTFTRLALRKLSPVGWLVRGSTALSATLAMGHIAHQLYSRGGGIIELAQGELAPGAAESSVIEASVELS